MGEYDRLPYTRALLAVFLSSVLQTVLFVVASSVLGVGLFAGWFLGIFVGAVLLRLCLGPFGWTISLKAAALTRIACGLVSGLVVGFIAAVFFATSEAGDGQRVVTIGPAVLLVAGVLELLTSAGAITFFAERLPDVETRTTWTPPAPSTDPNARTIGGAAVYSADDFLTDTSRAGRRG